VVSSVDDALLGHTAEDLERLDRAHVWHPFTHMRDHEPLIIVRGDGARLQDARGRWYLDATSSIWLNVHGYRVREIDDAVRAQLDNVAHSTLLGLGNVPSVLFAERLVRVAPPGLTRVFYADNGAGAVEAAIKIAVQFWSNQGRSRPYVLGFTGNYHGDTLGAVGVAPDELFHRSFLELLPGHPRVPYPDPYRSDDPDRCLADTLTAVATTLRRRDDIGAAIVEPIQGAGGIVVPPPGLLAGLRSLCDAHDALLIVDEVATGFGRTGRMWACDAEGVAPDLLCTGKGISGGYLPVAATLATERVFDEFLGAPEDGRTFFHGHSYAGNALGCAAALASLDLLEPLLPLLPNKVALLARELSPLADEPHVGNVRQAGFMAGVELVRDRSERAPYPYASQAGWVVARAARARGLLVRPIGNVVVFMPAPGASKEEFREMTSILRDAFIASRDDLAELATR
jgi:adenosylmethionine---8-amino-7-oxononanoate aminotransferase